MPPKKSSASSDECVRVVVRVRPRNDGEMRNNNKVIVNMISETAQVCVERPDGEKQYFTFDSVYDHDSRQDTLFEETARPIIDSVIEGYNGTIFAYGQTGTGKTHTMEGRWEPAELRGITPRAFVHVFDRVASTKADEQYLVRASYLEIYNEEVRDLLSKEPKNKLELKEHPEHGTYVKDLSSFPVRTVQEMEQVLNAGKKNRSVGATLMNQDSSRSHSIFTIIVESSAVRADGQKGLRAGKLNLVDLAGSERQSKTGATGDRLTEATKINASLSALGNVISALVAAKAGHVPYRDSKLTRLLQDSLGGNTKTVMVANLGPADYNFDETMSTLRYADRAKQIKNKPRINEDPKDTMIREFQAEIEKLRAQVASGGGGGGGNSAESERMVRQIELEKAAISQQKDLAESEKARIAQQLEAKQQEILAEKQKAENAARQLRAMEEKLMHGGQNLLQKTEQQELELKEKERRLEEERLEKRRLERKMEEMEEAALQENQKFDSIQEELESKSDKLKKLFSKYQRMKSELRDIQVEFERDKEEMLDQIRALNREVKLKEIVIRHFIPPAEVRKIESRCRYDEDNDEWYLDKPQLTGNAIRRPQSATVNGKRPVSAAAKAAARMGVDNPRFKSENVLNLELDMPDRTTRDYDDRGFDDGEVFSVPAIPNVYFSYPSERDGAFGDDQRARQRSAGSERGGGSARPSSAARRDKPKTAQGSRPESTAGVEEYPSAKGPGRR